MTWRKSCRWIALGLTLLLFAGGVAAWMVGGALVAPAQRPVKPLSDELPIVATAIKSSSGSQLAAWHIPVEGARATVVLLHPIRENRRAMWGRAVLLHQAGYDVVMVDLQAHGESSGNMITAGLLERLDVQATVEYVRRTSPGHRVAIVGWSLGGAATLLASPLELDALVIESVYPTISEAIHNRIAMRVGALSHVLTPILLWQLPLRTGISPHDLRPIDQVSHVGCPLLIAGGDQDQHTTLAETQRMFAAAKEPKQLVIFPKAAHVDLLEFDRERYRREILAFLEEHLHGL